MVREFRGGLGPQVNWERKERRRMALALEECGRGARRQSEGGPRAGGIDDDDVDGCLETLSDDPERDDAWNQFDPMDYHALVSYSKPENEDGPGLGQRQKLYASRFY